MSTALASMEAEETALVAKLEAVRQVITGMRAYLGITDAPSVTVPTRQSAPVSRGSAPKVNGRSAPDIDTAERMRVAAVLKDGPLLVADFLRKTKLSKWQGRELVRTGAIVATGTTVSRRYALPGTPAKEAP